MARYGNLGYTFDSVNEFGKELDRTNVISDDFKDTLWIHALNIMHEAIEKTNEVHEKKND